MLRVVDPMTINPTTRAAAAANTGRQRMATHSSKGNTKASGKAVAQGPSGKEIKKAVSAMSAMSPAQPSISSGRGSRSRLASPSSMSSGETVTIPSEDAANQRRHTYRGDVVGSMELMANAAPAAAIADPAALAAKNPST